MGLKALALEKFKAEAMAHWNNEEFSQAANEVYTSTIESDRGLRDIVVNTVCQHPVVMDKEDIQDVVKSLDLGFDMLTHLRKSGNW
jgi:hypothetical protein